MSGPTGAERGTVAVTGAAGSLAGDVIPGLVELGYDVLGIDLRAPTPELAGTRWVTCSINDRDALTAALDGCDAILHLAGIPLEAEWEQILEVNIDGTHAVLESARRAGVQRAVLASSIHAAGYVEVPADGTGVPDDVPVAPNTFYGVSKAALEALGSLYHHRHGMDVLCLRIASRFPRPENERMLSTWLSPTDAVALVHAALSVPRPGFRLVWGVSANTRSYLTPDGGAAIGFHPRDDAETYEPDLVAARAHDPGVAATEWDRRYIGGVFSSPTPPRFRPYDERDTAGPRPDDRPDHAEHHQEVAG